MIAYILRTCDFRELKRVKKNPMSRSKMSGWERNTGKREMATSTEGDMDLKRSDFDRGLSLARADTKSSRSIRACWMLGLAGERESKREIDIDTYSYKLLLTLTSYLHTLILYS